MALFLFLNTANTTVLSAAKNGLFLSEYEPELIPYAVIAAALLTAAVAVIFTGVVAGTDRRTLAIGLTAVLGLSILTSRALFMVDPRSTFAIYLLLSAVQVLVLTHAWDYAGSMLTGRQAKRLLPMIGIGASLGAIAGGTGVAPTARGLGTANLLWISVTLVVAALPLLWLVNEPTREPEDSDQGRNVLIGFLARSGHGIQAVSSNQLLRLLALGLIGLTMTGTLIDLQLKFVLKESFGRDDITAIYGLMSAGVGVGTLLLQFWASKVLFPRHGVSFAAMLHGTALLAAAGGTALVGGLVVLILAQALDDVLQFSLQKPVEQVSLLPFPGRIKSVALATLGGVLRPLSKATGGGVALLLADSPRLLPLATVGAAGIAVGAYSRHRKLYMGALESALTRHAVDMSEVSSTPLVVDRSMIAVIERGLQDSDATVVIFATSMLEQLPAEEALPRLAQLIKHDVPEVRAEAASVFGRLDAPLDFATGMSIAAQLAEEDVAYVVAALLDSVGRAGGIEPDSIVRFLQHDDNDVRRAALVALGRLDWVETDETLRSMLGQGSSRDQILASGAVGELQRMDFMIELTDLIEESEVRPAALDALARLGSAAVPVLASVLDRRELPLPLRRTVITALASIKDDQAKTTLVALVNEPALGPAALHSLSRMREEGTIGAVEEAELRTVLREQMQDGLLLSAASSIIRAKAKGPADLFIAAELQGLHTRSVHRVMKVLALSYDPTRIATIDSALLSDNPARRSNALELLEGTIDQASSALIMPFMDIVAEGMPLQRTIELIPNGRRVQKTPADALVDLDDWWTRALALHYLGRDAEIALPGRSQDDVTEEVDMMPLIEKVMILKGSEFFRNFPGSDLAGIAALTDVIHVQKDEVIFEQGEDGDAFYIVVQGAVRITRGATLLATLGSREGFGEMAILDKESRSASATAAEDSTLLSLDRDSFDRVIEQSPVVARGVYRVLTERLRNTLAQVAAS
jgi:HEAT repeat protein